LAHSPQGCFQLVDAAFGWQDADYTETMTLCTKLCEDEIVHGGEELLARTIRQARDLAVPIVFVLTACGPEIVGDDIAAVCDELAAQMPFRLVPVRCAGFLGDQNHGADIALQAIVDHLVDEGASGPRIPRSVCLVAPHANANPTWMGDLQWVQKVLSELGATVTATLTHGTTLADLARIPQTEGCLVLSHDAGQACAALLSQRYGLERWCADLPLPIGFTNTARWLLELGSRLGATQSARRLVAAGETAVVERCRRKGLEQSGLHRAPAAIVADATVGLPLIRMITEDLEMVPELVCLRSGQAGTDALLARELADLTLQPQVIWNVDVFQAKMALEQTAPEMILCSNIEHHAVCEVDSPFVIQIVNPIAQSRLVDRAYWGYPGMLNLIEAIQNGRQERYRSKRRRYAARW
jgi:nitrogenase molybdenum-iron protein alpha/beta subunit